MYSTLTNDWSLIKSNNWTFLINLDAHKTRTQLKLWKWHMSHSILGRSFLVASVGKMFFMKDFHECDISFKDLFFARLEIKTIVRGIVRINCCQTSLISRAVCSLRLHMTDLVICTRRCWRPQMYISPYHPIIGITN